MSDESVEVLTNQSYAHIRGFNYQPGYASHGIHLWIDKFDIEQIDRELAAGKRCYPGLNTIRLWMSHDAWMIEPKLVAERVAKVVPLASKHDVKFILTLFNGWHSIPAFGGFTPEQLVWAGEEGYDNVFGQFVRDLVEPHIEDPNILFWDMSNEPYNNASNDNEKKLVSNFLKRTFDLIKSLGATQPVSVSHQVVNDEFFDDLHQMTDLFFIHPYWTRNRKRSEHHWFVDSVNEAVSLANSVDKALIATECCWGAWEDEVRGEILEFELNELHKRGIGFIPHLMHETKVADGHRRDLAITVPGGAGYMAFVNRDGTPRAHHELYNKLSPAK